MKQNVAAVVVTYNRKQLLTECINAILNQTVQPDKILVINNASTDGTEVLFEKGNIFYQENIHCVNMETNTGGSGGFYEGLKRVLHEEVMWAWIMDDDTIPEPDCLEKLLFASDIVQKGTTSGKKASFFASTIFGPDHEFMNVPNINLRESENGYPYYYEYLDKTLLNIIDATFVSLLIRKSAIEQCGLPCKDYFIWGDDGEYTLRLTHYFGPAYMVGNSVAIHKRYGAKKLRIENFSDPDRIKMYHYYVRNNIINSLYYKKDRNTLTTVAKKVFQAFASLRQISKKYGLLKCYVVWKGTIEGFANYRKFKNYIDSQLKGNI
ncbi:MAG: glycosyltransferase family 2 protein [Lachnospiraceae bacterium]|nr:glycosyltransferase family 2 protein [Lachnospiraceae bacterium]